MSLDFHNLFQLRKNHPARRLLQADPATRSASFFDKVFIQPNIRLMGQSGMSV